MAQDNNNVDKGLYAAPQGMEELAEMEPDLEIEIEDPEEVTIRAGGMEIEIDPDRMDDDEFNKNLAEEIDEGDLENLASELLEDYAG